MPPSTGTEEIIEKKSGSPVATSCLIIAMVALIAAMVLQVMEIGEYRKQPLKFQNLPNPADAKVKEDITAFQKSVESILEKKAAGGDAAGDAEPAAADEPAGDTEKPAATPAADAADAATEAAADADAKDSKDAAATPEPAEPPAVDEK